MCQALNTHHVFHLNGASHSASFSEDTTSRTAVERSLHKRNEANTGLTDGGIATGEEGCRPQNTVCFCDYLDM